MKISKNQHIQSIKKHKNPNNSSFHVVFVQNYWILCSLTMFLHVRKANNVAIANKDTQKNYILHTGIYVIKKKRKNNMYIEKI